MKVHDTFSVKENIVKNKVKKMMVYSYTSVKLTVHESVGVILVYWCESVHERDGVILVY